MDYETHVRPTSARLCRNIPLWDNNKKRGKAREGLRYEKKVHEEFTRRYPSLYVPSLWLEYENAKDSYLHRCQPDGLLFNFPLSRIIVIEVKLKHTAQAYYQLRNLYLPVLSLIFPPSLWELVPCEVVKWFDPSTTFPSPTRLCREPLYASRGKNFNVHIFNE